MIRYRLCPADDAVGPLAGWFRQRYFHCDGRYYRLIYIYQRHNNVMTVMPGRAGQIPAAFHRLLIFDTMSSPAFSSALPRFAYT